MPGFPLYAVDEQHNSLQHYQSFFILDDESSTPPKTPLNFLAQLRRIIPSIPPRRPVVPNNHRSPVGTASATTRGRDLGRRLLRCTPSSSLPPMSQVERLPMRRWKHAKDRVVRRVDTRGMDGEKTREERFSLSDAASYLPVASGIFQGPFKEGDSKAGAAPGQQEIDLPPSLRASGNGTGMSCARASGSATNPQTKRPRQGRSQCEGVKPDRPRAPCTSLAAIVRGREKSARADD
jgi:hypothetical protein